MRAHGHRARLGDGSRVQSELVNPRAASRTALVLLIAASGVARAEPTDPGVIVLHAARLDREEDAVLQALRIYTRDLDRAVIAAGDAPEDTSRATLKRTGDYARARNAAVAVWIERQRDARLLVHVLDTREMDLRAVEVGVLGLADAAEEAALKVRATLSRPPRPPSTDAAGANPSAAPGAVHTTSTTTGESRELAGAPLAAQAAKPLQFELAATYGVVVPAAPAWWHQALGVAVAYRVSSRPWLFVMDAAWTTGPAHTLANRQVRFGDIPLGLSAAWVWSFQRVSLAAGPRAAVHVYDVTEEAMDGGTGEAHRVGVGVGGLVRTAFRLSRRTLVALAVHAEGGLLRQAFSANGDTQITLGTSMLGTEVEFAVALW